MRKLLVLLALTMMGLIANACGSPEDGDSSEKRAPGEPTAIEPVQVAYRETAAERTAKTTFEVTTTSPPVDPGAEGEPAPMVLKIRGEGVTNFSGTEFALTVNMLGTDGFEMRQLHGTVYMKAPEDARPPGFSGEKPWIRVGADEAYEQQGPALTGAPGEGTQDPARQLEYLRGVSDSVEKAGRESVRGVPTTRYEVVVDLDEVAAAQDEETRGAYDQMIGQLGTSKVPFEVWIDDQNLARRVSMDVIVQGPENPATPEVPKGDATRLSMVTEYYAFGTPLNVQAPPRDQTTDGSKLLAGEQTVAQ